MRDFFKNLLGMNKDRTNDPLNLKTKPCIKDPTKICPNKNYITYNGSIGTKGLLKCCKIQDSMKRMRENIAKLEPGKNYNGTSFSKELIESCKRSIKKDK